MKVHPKSYLGKKIFMATNITDIDWAQHAYAAYLDAIDTAKKLGDLLLEGLDHTKAIIPNEGSGFDRNRSITLGKNAYKNTSELIDILNELVGEIEPQRDEMPFEDVPPGTQSLP